MALSEIQQALPIPVIGVIEPGAQAALNSSAENPKNRVILSEAPERAAGESNGAESKDLHLLHATAYLGDPHVLVLATPATVQSHAYTRALNSLGLAAHEKACPLLVPLVEEGWINHPVTDQVLKIYLTEALTANPESQTLLLGCTHYPLLEPAIRRTLEALNHPLNIIDSAESTAHATAALVSQHFPNLATTTKPTCTFYATDSIEKFQRLGTNFLGQPVTNVNLVDLGG
jgi:glutamate racemase